MSDVAAIVLAAGLSRRMGKVNKLLLSVDGEVLVRRIVAACAAVTDHQVTVVTGHQPDAVKSALHDMSVTFVHNPRFEEGQMTSVDAGLKDAPETSTYLLALGDQPKIKAACLEALLHAHRANGDGRITVPMVAGVRGNPIVIPSACQ